MNVYYTDTAKQQLKELERHFQKRILDKVAVYASLPNPLEFAEPLAGYDMNRFRVGDYRVAFHIDQNIISLADIRQTTNSVNPLCAVSDSSLAATAELSATPPSHPPGEWPTSANERYLLQKLSLFRVAAFFIADVGNGLILGCSSEFESSVCSQVPF
jgi:mRNA-degrading endonuclease RelE of RelBE toxin-antitoxin system